ncbi:prolyl 4-hydroxylase subunit alpha-2-like [Parambassis ranga]|uniref:Prolyl 4-hydroxylase subunit alpha-2-like n=1 Tax=Parambassis ranga TaxID=210632 RepID=A0A6P7K9F1_9TELE|nr:prolyl 4-hydroxylase subunit alpha-2-like [Parambassis ranga]
MRMSLHRQTTSTRYVVTLVRQEDEWDQPHVVLYYSILSDKEMEKVEELDKLRTAVSHVPARHTETQQHSITVIHAEFILMGLPFVHLHLAQPTTFI